MPKFEIFRERTEGASIVVEAENEDAALDYVNANEEKLHWYNWDSVIEKDIYINQDYEEIEDDSEEQTC